MPIVDGKKYPYTPAGKVAANKAKVVKKSKQPAGLQFEFIVLNVFHLALPDRDTKRIENLI